MRLNDQGLAERAAWEAAGYTLPRFDRRAMRAETKRAPQWVHFGAGNIFKAFQAVEAQKLLDDGLLRSGIIAVERSESPEKRASYEEHDDLTVLVTLKSDGSVSKSVVGSIAEVRWLLSDDASERERLREIFTAPSLQLASFTITEKGYLVGDASDDLAAGPVGANSYWGRVAALLFARWEANAAPLAMVSMDNCSHNGDKLKAAILYFARGWAERGHVSEAFAAYLEEKVSFPWTMIDKITPAPDASVAELLHADGLDLAASVTARGTHIAPFVNAEECEYLVVEDHFPNGRPPLEKTGVLFTDRDTVNRAERMKVCTCLNPLHTALAVSGCLLGYTRISEEMKDPELVRLACGIGYDEGLNVAADPGVIDPRAFLDTVVNVRIPNPFLPDTPQRIATDTSQKVPIRFGETIKSYVERPDLDAKSLTFIPLAIALWLRYLLAVDDEHKPFECSGDPLLKKLQSQLSCVRPGHPETAGDEVLAPILSDKTLFAADLVEAELAPKIGDMLRELLAGPGAVRATLKKYTSAMP
ncbi:MAG: mannitol dehydrogenase family protein [Oscillospiraceae bacterium]|nr:mannitol dehydrogenase family protein [Oscillospiraceae bacterium]